MLEGLIIHRFPCQATHAEAQLGEHGIDRLLVGRIGGQHMQEHVARDRVELGHKHCTVGLQDLSGQPGLIPVFKPIHHRLYLVPWSTCLLRLCTKGQDGQNNDDRQSRRTSK